MFSSFYWHELHWFLMAQSQEELVDEGQMGSWRGGEPRQSFTLVAWLESHQVLLSLHSLLREAPVPPPLPSRLADTLMESREMWSNHSCQLWFLSPPLSRWPSPHHPLHSPEAFKEAAPGH